jgi:hypothetical protein
VHGIARTDYLFAGEAGRSFGAVCSLREQTIGGGCDMSALQKRLRLPQTYLALLFLAAGFASLDSLRAPDEQWTARAYVSAVHAYQHVVSPRLNGHVQCRFEPTCSHYSEEAVARFGIRKGLKMTVQRLLRCRSNVPIGTRDEVPAANITSSSIAR